MKLINLFYKNNYALLVLVCNEDATAIQRKKKMAKRKITAME